MVYRTDRSIEGLTKYRNSYLYCDISVIKYRTILIICVPPNFLSYNTRINRGKNEECVSYHLMYIRSNQSHHSDHILLTLGIITDYYNIFEWEKLANRKSSVNFCQPNNSPVLAIHAAHSNSDSRNSI